eukprot:scaffold8113_cov67-Phaeocystis_antarctica.AAC.10
MSSSAVAINARRNGTKRSLLTWSSTDPVFHDAGLSKARRKRVSSRPAWDPSGFEPCVAYATIASTRDPSEATAVVSSSGRLTSTLRPSVVSRLPAAAVDFIAMTTAAAAKRRTAAKRRAMHSAATRSRGLAKHTTRARWDPGARSCTGDS